MTNENKLASMDAVGELPDFGNLLLREGGYPHLSNTQEESRSDAWNDASILPTECKVYQTRLNENDPEHCYQLWCGNFWDMPSDNIEDAAKIIGKSSFQNLQWREVQP